MIKANELRINNYVLLNTSSLCGPDFIPAQIHEIKNISTNCGTEYELFNYDPIPLTPEILEKCGFDGNELNIKSTGHQACLSMNDDKSVSLWVEGHYEFGKCKYLHQLQNLFVALTGEELNVKL